MVVILDCGMGNLQSVVRAFQKTGVPVRVSASPGDLEEAGRIVLPGVGSFDQGMRSLRDTGLLPVLERRVHQDKVPVIGICLGMQMLTEGSEEGSCPGLGWIRGRTRRFQPNGQVLKIPHLGWNEVETRRESPLLGAAPANRCFYFAHSYYVSCDEEGDVLATTRYGQEFVSALNRGNIYGTQFHPEKSHADGLRIIENFVKAC